MGLGDLAAGDEHDVGRLGVLDLLSQADRPLGFRLFGLGGGRRWRELELVWQRTAFIIGIMSLFLCSMG